MGKRELLLYTSRAHPAGSRLKETVARMIPPQETLVVHTLTGLAQRLGQLNHGLKAVVLLAASRKDLGELLNLAPLLDQVRVLLILPDAEAPTIALGHRLQPRYLTHISSDFKDVAAVLHKILQETLSSRRLAARRLPGKGGGVSRQLHRAHPRGEI